MSMLHPFINSACVRYFYLPANSERNAEIIEVLNSTSETVEVPTREEDLELEAFFVRALSIGEIESYQVSHTWKVFSSWEDLQQDHIKYKLPESILQQLLQFRNIYTLQEEMAA